MQTKINTRNYNSDGQSSERFSSAKLSCRGVALKRCIKTGGKWVKYNEKFICLYFLFHELTYRLDPSTDFQAWWHKRRGLVQEGCTFCGFVDIPHFGGEIVFETWCSINSLLIYNLTWFRFWVSRSCRITAKLSQRTARLKIVWKFILIYFVRQKWHLIFPITLVMHVKILLFRGSTLVKS